MSSTMPRLAFVAIALAWAGVASPSASAQQLSARSTANASNGGGALASQQTVKGQNQRPAFHAFGTPVIINAPVDAPYNSASAYSTYAGQPAYGPNAVLANSVQGAP